MCGLYTRSYRVRIPYVFLEFMKQNVESYRFKNMHACTDLIFLQRLRFTDDDNRTYPLYRITTRRLRRKEVACWWSEA